MNKSILFGGLCWSVFGIGALLGPVLLGKLADLIGLKKSILLGFFIKSIAVFMPILIQSDFYFYVSSFIVGFFTTGLVTVISSYSLNIFGEIKYKIVWSNLTLGFSLFQAIGGFSMSFFIVDNNYIPLFYVGGFFLLASFFLILSIKDKKDEYKNNLYRKSSN